MSLKQPGSKSVAADPRLAPLFDDLGRAELLATRVLGSPDLAQDAVQEACMRYIRRPPHDQGPAAARAYFLRTVHGTAVDLARNEAARRARHESREAAPAMQPAPAAAAALREAALAARREMSGLPVDLRTAICLCCEQGLTQAEAAEILDVPRKTVADRVGRGLDKLRERLSAAGFGAVSAAALVPALGALGVPPASAALAAKVGTMVQGVTLGTATTVGAASAAQGGVAVKIVAGIVIAGALAGSVAVWGGGGDARPLASPPASDGKEAYACELIIGQFTQGGSTGPGGISQGGFSYDRAFSAKRNRLYWFNGASLASYDPATGLVEILAGSGAGGDLDAPGEAWRGSSWGYQQSGAGLDDEKGLFYVLSSNKVKVISLDDGSLRTVGSAAGISSMCLGSDGNIYTASWGGVCRMDPKTGQSTKLSTEAFPGKDHTPWGYMAVDLKRNKAYGHSRGDIYGMDFGTGKITLLCGGGQSFAAGPFKEAGWYCPTGAQMSAEDRYLYVGGGDQQTFLRLDLEKQVREMLIRTGKGADARWTWGDTGNKKDPGVFPWPSQWTMDARTGDVYFEIPVWPAAVRLKRVK